MELRDIIGNPPVFHTESKTLCVLPAVSALATQGRRLWRPQALAAPHPPTLPPFDCWCCPGGHVFTTIVITPTNVRTPLSTLQIKASYITTAAVSKIYLSHERAGVFQEATEESLPAGQEHTQKKWMTCQRLLIAL